MLLYSRTEYIASNLVSNAPSLPGVPYGKAKLTYAEQLEAVPTITITLEIIPQERLDEIRSAYSLNKIISINGYRYKVVGYADARENLPHITKEQRTIPNTYQIQVNLIGAVASQIEKTVKLRKLVQPRSQSRPEDGIVSLGAIAAQVGAKLQFGKQLIVDGKPDNRALTSLDEYLTEVARIRGGVLRYSNPAGIEIIKLSATHIWNILPQQVIDNGTRSLQVPPVYDDMELTGDFNNYPETPEEFTVIQEEPQIEVLITQDLNPEEPPLDSVFLRDLSSNHDLSGPTHTRITTTNINGAPASILREIFGFTYTGQDIHLQDGLMLGEDPALYWRLVEYHLETYNYEQLSGGIILTANVYEPGQDQQHRVPIYLDPDTQTDSTVRILGSSGVWILPETEYLTNKTGTGYIRTRFQAEQENNQGVPQTIQLGVFDDVLAGSDPVEIARYNSFQFFNLPILSVQSYVLEPERKYYIENVGEPVSFDVVKVSELSVGQLSRIRVGATSNHGFIALARPSTNFNENFLIMEEALDERGFRTTPHPDAQSGTVPLPPPFIVGKETINRTSRKVLIPRNRTKRPKDTPEKYEEFSSTYAAQDPGFSASLAQKKLNQKSGRPPTASTRRFTFAQKPDLRNRFNSARYKYSISSDRQEFKIKSGGSQNYPQATTIAQGLAAARVTLQLAQLQSLTIDKVITWYYPSMKAGDRILLEGVLHSILGITYTLNYEQGKIISASDGSTYFEQPVTCDGMNVQVSEWISRSIFVDRKPDDQATGGDSSSSFTYNGGGEVLGEIPDLKLSRRSV